MTLDCILFDLDDTLVVEVGSAEAALFETCRLAERKHGIDPQELMRAVFREAKPIWYSAPAREYCVRVGVSSWEGLWARFEGEESDLRTLREWAPTYRIEAWYAALVSLGVDDRELAAELAREAPGQRRRRHVRFDDSTRVLETLRGRLQMALITNGLPCWQREKIAGAGLEPYFDIVVISGELGVAKPSPAIYKHALRELAADPARALMVGNSVKSDIGGAQAAGIRAVLIDRGDIHGADDSITPDFTIEGLDELLDIIAELSSCRIAHE